jgi:hypothetical protein
MSTQLGKAGLCGAASAWLGKSFYNQVRYALLNFRKFIHAVDQGLLKP